MKPIVLIPNSSGKIELTKEELQKLLEDAYEQGKHDAPQYVPWWGANNVPYVTTTDLKDYEIHIDAKENSK